ncbi:MAG: hypothetical protein Q8K37_03330 [Alphaproteobacteria bacterium]|nr:hypothetical protein [Alphaproteobacteria bacterium]
MISEFAGDLRDMGVVGRDVKDIGNIDIYEEAMRLEIETVDVLYAFLV